MAHHATRQLVLAQEDGAHRRLAQQRALVGIVAAQHHLDAGRRYSLEQSLGMVRELTAALLAWRDDPQVLAMVAECVAKVNADLAAEEGMSDTQIARFLVLHKELDPDDDELTRTRKVRRGFIEDKYAVLIDALYAGRSEQFIETQVKFEDGRTGTVSATLPIRDTQRYPAVAAAA